MVLYQGGATPIVRTEKVISEFGSKFKLPVDEGFEGFQVVSFRKPRDRK